MKSLDLEIIGWLVVVVVQYAAALLLRAALAPDKRTNAAGAAT